MVDFDWLKRKAKLTVCEMLPADVKNQVEVWIRLRWDFSSILATSYDFSLFFLSVEGV